MEALYPYVHIIHLILGIMFLGYVFSDLAVISALKKKFSGEVSQEINRTLGQRSFKIFPLTLLFIVLTGGMMMSRYSNTEAGFFETNLQQILILKIFLALIIVSGVLYNLFSKLTNRPKSPFMQEHFHKLVIVLGLGIVICAKVMFIV